LEGYARMKASPRILRMVTQVLKIRSKQNGHLI
jgi:hypothetical protein